MEKLDPMLVFESVSRFAVARCLFVCPAMLDADFDGFRKRGVPRGFGTDRFDGMKPLINWVE
jgi:hypothetical protein